MKYDSEIQHSAAFNVIEEAIHQTSHTRLAKLLNIQNGWIIQYVPIGTADQNIATSSSDNDEMSLRNIIIVVVLAVLLTISVMVIWKVAKLRRSVHVVSPVVNTHDDSKV